ncbi:Squalene epoxidase [Coemansia nantahalensis]|nr:Squalene epoxidase [Coemansia nantahalensis]
MAELDENASWPTHGTYEYSSHYSSRKEVVEYAAFDGRQAFDHVVIGAGPVGAALAFALARGRAGVRVLVVEKSWDEPDRIVGELMQPAGCQALERLGLGSVFSGIGAVPVHGYHIAYRGKQIFVPYMAGADGARLCGNSFHHGRLVMNLRAACKAQPNIVCLEAAGTELLGDADASGRFTVVRGVRVGPPRAAEEDAAHVDVFPRGTTFVCDGISSQFRRQLNAAPVEMVSHFCGLVLDHDPVESAEFFEGPTGATTHVARPDVGSGNPLPMPHNGNVMLDGVGPVLLYQLSERQTRVLADIPGAQLPSEASGRLRAVLRESLARAVPSSVYPGLHAKLMHSLNSARRIRCIGCKFIPAIANNIDGALWLGDALNVRHPLTGGGMTVGLWDVVLLSEALRDESAVPDARAMRRIKARWQCHRRPRAMVINVLSIALYSLFSAETRELALLREACFRYLAQGGIYAMHPSGFLSGLMPSPLLLVYHFFSTAFVAVYLRVADKSVAYPGDSLLFRVYSAFYTLFIAATVILPPVWKELQP